MLAPNKQAAIDCVNALAPEHLHIQTRDPEAFSDEIDNAGAIFLGPFTPVAVGRLRRRAVARAADRRHRAVLQRADRQRLPQADEHHAVHPQRPEGDRRRTWSTWRTTEGLTGHAASVEVRANDNGPAARPKPKPDKVPVAAGSKK